MVQNLNLGLHCGLFIEVSIYLGCNMKTGKNNFFFLFSTCRFYNDFSPNMLRLNLVISKSKWRKMPLQINNYKLKKSKVPIIYYYIYYKGAIFFPYRFVHEKLFIGVQNNKVWLHLYLFSIFRKIRLTMLFFFWQIFYYWVISSYYHFQQFLNLITGLPAWVV